MCTSIRMYGLLVQPVGVASSFTVRMKTTTTTTRELGWNGLPLHHPAM